MKLSIVPLTERFSGDTLTYSDGELMVGIAFDNGNRLNRLFPQSDAEELVSIVNAHDGLIARMKEIAAFDRFESMRDLKGHHAQAMADIAKQALKEAGVYHA